MNEKPVAIITNNFNKAFTELTTRLGVSIEQYDTNKHEINTASTKYIIVIHEDQLRGIIWRAVKVLTYAPTLEESENIIELAKLAQSRVR